ncbi:hypothetical protein CEXT_127931 [Caerostris extrusa]|uniref:Uncharacterized protein n=1 Tax=Caerostris extrusa TaxID=172846 RepID=A0AAV4SNY8_CAEEX|nr:hypothetical protein CEXT_127931 [Caerostris extrusa]
MTENRKKKTAPYPLTPSLEMDPRSLSLGQQTPSAEEGERVYLGEESLEKEKRGRTSGDKALLKKPIRACFRVEEKRGETFENFSRGIFPLLKEGTEDGAGIKWFVKVRNRS